MRPRSLPGEPHYSVEFEDRGDGWWTSACSCGKQFAMYPSAEDLCDALMQHAYEQAWIDRGKALNDESSSE